MFVSSYLVFVIFMIIALKTLGQYLFQRSVKKYNRTFIILGIVCYAVLGYLFHEMLVIADTLAVTNIIASNISDLLIILMGWMLFKQHLTIKQFIGIGVVIVGSYLVI